MSALIGKKIGMTRIFSEQGKAIPVTVVQVGPCYVTQIKTKEHDGYEAVQLGYGLKREKLVTKPVKGHLKKSGAPALRVLKEFRNFKMDGSIKLGAELRASVFAIGDKVAVTGISRGKGFSGGIKRHHFGGGPKTHGQSDRLRAPGSVGQSSYPSRVLKGTRMAGRMGNEQVTVKTLKVVRIDPENNFIMIKGAVPGSRNGIVYIKKS